MRRLVSTNKPKFDPSKPFQAVDGKPKFDPRKPFEEVQPGKLESAARGAAQGASFGFADEISGAVESALTDKTYQQARDESRANFKSAQQANPVTYGAGELGGGVATAFVPGLNLARGASLAKQVGAAAVAGGVGGFGLSEAKDAKGLARDTAIGAGVGGAVGGVAGAVMRGAGKIADGAKFAGKRAVGLASDLNPESVDFYLANRDAVNSARDLKPIAEDLFDGGRELASRVSRASGESADILARDEVSVPKAQILQRIDEQMSALEQGGMFTAGAERELAALQKMRDRLIAGKENLVGGQVKQFIRQMDDVAYPGHGGAAEIPQGLSRQARDLRHIASEEAKTQSPAFREKMAEVAGMERVRSGIEGKLSTPEKAYNTARGLAQERNPFTNELFEAVDKANGTNLTHEARASAIRDVFEAPRYNGSRNVNVGGTIGEASGGPVGKAIGAVLGYAKDVLARPAAKKSLDIAIALEPHAARLGKFAKPLMEAAARGPAAFIYTHQLLLRNPEYQALNAEQPQ